MRAPTDRPNIVLINCDDAGYGDFGCYGATANWTPNVDRLAAEGVRLTDFSMASSVCTPSRAAMMTGCYPQRVGLGTGDEGKVVLFPGDATGLHEQEITIADLLKERGYATQLVGKWHLGDQAPFMPTRHGFDHYYGLPYSNDMGIQTNREQFPPLPLVCDEDLVQQQPDQAGITERYVEEATRFIRNHRDEPFFLYFAEMYVHLPLIVPEVFARRSRNGAYGAAVECIDWSVGAILHELERLGIEEHTIVIFTSDNGSNAKNGGSNAPLRGHKGTWFEGGFRVPGIVRFPGRFPAGVERHAMTTAMDLLPTLARLAGTEAPADRVIDGHDITPILDGTGPDASPYDAFLGYRKDELRTVRDGRWKLHLEEETLYDLDADVGETTDRAADHPDVVERLRARAEAARRDLGDARTRAAGEGVRPVGRVANPEPLTSHDPNHPYIVAMYDTQQAG